MVAIHFILMLCASTSLAQTPASPAPKYVRFEIDGNPEETLTRFLRTKPGQDLFQNLLQGKLKDLLQEPPENLRELIQKDLTGDPFLRELVDQFLKANPELPKGDPGQLSDALRKFGEQLQGDKALGDAILKGIEGNLGGDFKDLIPKLVPPVAPDTIKPDAGKSSSEWIDLGDGFKAKGNWVEDANGVKNFIAEKVERIAPEESSVEDRFGEWLRDWLNDKEHQEEIADFLRDTPGLRDAVADFAKSLRGEFGDAAWVPKLPDPGPWGLDLKPPKLPFDMARLPKLPTIAMPKLPRVNVPMPRLGEVSMPRIPGFGGGPRIPSAPSITGGGDWTIVVVVVLGLAATWWLARYLRNVRPANWNPLNAALVELPRNITTRTELRQAFDRLALAKLGEPARSLHHHAVARQLSVDGQEQAARAFAKLYERARYTLGDERLTAEEQLAVRDSVAALTQRAT